VCVRGVAAAPCSASRTAGAGQTSESTDDATATACELFENASSKTTVQTVVLAALGEGVAQRGRKHVARDDLLLAATATLRSGAYFKTTAPVVPGDTETSKCSRCRGSSKARAAMVVSYRWPFSVARRRASRPEVAFPLVILQHGGAQMACACCRSRRLRALRAPVVGADNVPAESLGAA